MVSNTSEETLAFIDFVPNLIRLGHKEDARQHLQKKFEQDLDFSISRWGQLPSQLVRIKSFEPLSTEARSLYIDGHFAATIALCGMAVEALCISVAEERVQNGNSKKMLLDPNVSVRDKIEPLKEYFKIDRTPSLLHQVLDIRKDYLHLHKTVTADIALECLRKLHLAILGEYGLVPDKEGKVCHPTLKDVLEIAEIMKIRFE